MKAPLLALVLGGLALSAGAFAEGRASDVNPEPAVRELDGKLLHLRFARNYQILRINAEVLPKVFSDAEEQSRLKKAVDFRKEQLVVFVWTSGGGDKLTYTVHNGGN